MPELIDDYTNQTDEDLRRQALEVEQEANGDTQLRRFIDRRTGNSAHPFDGNQYLSRYTKQLPSFMALRKKANAVRV